MRFAFRFRWIPFVAMLLVAAIGIALGEWQRGRANQKDDLAATLNQRAMLDPFVLRAGAPMPAVDQLEFRRVIARGEFLADWPVYLDNRPYGGVPGFYVLMPFRIADNGPIVLVMRGWLARDARERTRLPPLQTPPGPITIEGMVRRHPGQVMQLGEPPPVRPGAIVQNLSPDDFAAASAMPVLNFIIAQSPDSVMPNTADPGNAGSTGNAGKGRADSGASAGAIGANADGLVRDWSPPSSGADKHRGYAFQWYALAATAFLFFLVTGIRRGSK